MLVLKRYLGESIVIGGDVEVSVVKLHSECPFCHRQHNNGSVRLGVTAPRHISVHRREVQDRIDAAERKDLGAWIMDDRSEVHERRVANAEAVRERLTPSERVALDRDGFVAVDAERDLG